MKVRCLRPLFATLPMPALQGWRACAHYLQHSRRSEHGMAWPIIYSIPLPELFPLASWRACAHYLQHFRCLRSNGGVPAPIICSTSDACAPTVACLRPLFAALPMPALQRWRACAHYLQHIRCLRSSGGVPAQIICSFSDACAPAVACLRPLFTGQSVPAPSGGACVHYLQNIRCPRSRMTCPR